MAEQQQRFPETPKTLPDFLYDYFEDCRSWAENNRPVQGINTNLTDADGGGKAINASFLVPPARTVPFQLIDVSTKEAHNIRVIYGEVNNMPPDGMSPGDSPQYVLSNVGNSGVIYIEVTTDDMGNITDVSIGFDATLPDDSDGDYHLSLGTFSTDVKQVFHLAQSASGSQFFNLCGGVTPEFWTVSAVSP